MCKVQSNSILMLQQEYFGNYQEVKIKKLYTREARQPSRYTIDY